MIIQISNKIKKVLRTLLLTTEKKRREEESYKIFVHELFYFKIADYHKYISIQSYDNWMKSFD